MRKKIFGTMYVYINDDKNVKNQRLSGKKKGIEIWKKQNEEGMKILLILNSGSQIHRMYVYFFFPGMGKMRKEGTWLKKKE